MYHLWHIIHTTSAASHQKIKCWINTGGTELAQYASCLWVAEPNIPVVLCRVEIVNCCVHLQSADVFGCNSAVELFAN